MSPRSTISLALSTALALTALGLPYAAAGEIELMGDGSETNNPDLLREGYRDCSYGCEVDDYSAEPYDPFFDVDWSVALRGSYVKTETSERFEAAVVPTVTLSHEGLRSSFDLIASAEIVKPGADPARLASLRAAFAGEYELDSVTLLAATGNLSITQDNASASGNPANTASAPQVISGEVEGSATRNLGFLDLQLRGRAGRTVYGTTTLVDASVIDNSWSNAWVYGAGIRVGHRITPIVSAFVDGSADNYRYDAASPTLLVELDGTEYALRGGLSADWGEVLEGEISVGVGLRRYDEPSLPEVAATLYDASVTFRPDETLALTGSVSTSIGAPSLSGPGTARIEHVAEASANYKVNPWLALRASASWRSATLVGSPETETGYSLGVGSDYLVSDHIAVSADYSFSHSETTPAPATDTHKVTLGVTFSR